MVTLERAVLGSDRIGIPEISEILIQPAGWAEGQPEWQSRIPQDLRDRVIEAVRRGQAEPPGGGPSLRASARSVAIQSGWSALNAMARASLSDMAAIAPPS